MSFQLKHLKKGKSEPGEVLSQNCLVVGNDLRAVSLYYKLLETGKGQTTLLSPTPLPPSDLRPLGPSLLRNKTGKTNALFFRDMKFHEFGGRVKSQKLSFQEEFFLSPPLSPQEREKEKHFPCLKDTDFAASLEKDRLRGTPSQISLRPSEGYKVVCTDKTVLECQKLYWMLEPQKFFKIYRGEKTSHLTEFCNPENSPSPLYVHYAFESPVTERTQTLFFPLSYSKADGHFIGEFSPGSSPGKQEVEFVTFISTEELRKEDISGKIRSLDRILAKAFPDFKTTPHKKFIRLTETTPFFNLKEDLQGRLLAQIQKESPRLFFAESL